MRLVKFEPALLTKISIFSNLLAISLDLSKTSFHSPYQKKNYKYLFFFFS